ncbi:undecaprenyl phosphate 4-deoxy-4-formamido-L-arabinose transferase [compost metagenome]
MSTPQFSLVVYLDKDAAILPDFLQDLRGFFSKFPVHYEVVHVVEKGSTGCVQILKQEMSNSQGKETLTLIENRSYLGRARSIYAGINKCQSPFIAVTSADLSTPLGDVFKLLQHVIAEDHVELCVGDRYKKRDSLFGKMPTPRAQLENLFNGILREKRQGLSQDPLCEIFALRRESWSKIQKHLKERKLKGWYFGPHLHKSLQGVDIKSLEIPIFDRGTSSISFVPWKERLRLFLLSLTY